MMNEYIEQNINPNFFDEDIRTHDQPLKGKRIFVRIGHWNQDAPGCIYGGVQEVDINMLNGKNLIPKLQYLGAKVVGTKQKMSTKEMAYYSNTKDVDMVLDLHCNASEKLTPSGILSFYWSENGKELAELIQDNVINLTGCNKGYNQKAKHSMVYYTNAVACIIEYGFLSNNEDRTNLLDAQWRSRANDGIVNAVIEYFKRRNL